MPLTDTVLDALIDAHHPLTLDDLDLVVAGITGTTPNPDDVDQAVAELLELDLVARRLVGPADTPAYALDLEVAP